MGSRLIVDLIARFYDRALPRHARGKLLDLGCGKVPLYGAYRDRVTAVICVDWPSSPHDTPHLDVASDLSEPLPFRGDTFDTIVLSDVLEHVSRPRVVWAEMARVLREGGKVIMNVPFYYWIHERPHDYFRYTEFALRGFVEEAGLTLVQLKRLGGSPEILADMVAKNALRVPWAGAAIAVGVQAITRRFVETKIGGKLSHKTAGAFPLGYCLVAAKA